MSKPGKRPVRRRAKGSPTHVICVPLKANQRDAHLIDQRLRLTGMLRNSILQSLLAAADELLKSAEWQSAKALPTSNKQERKARGDRLKELRYQAGLYRDGANRTAHAHWKAGPYSDLLDSWTSLALGAEVWASVEPWLFGQRGRPRFKRSDQRDTVWGNGPKLGLRRVDDDLVWQSGAIRSAPKSSKLSRKRLQVPLDFTALSKPRRDYLESCRLLRAGIRRQRVRGKTQYVALLCVDGLPYRNQAYLDQAAAATGPVGLDMNVSSLAVATKAAAEKIPLADPAMLEARRQEAALERRRKRALDRSRRANNPHAFKADGRSQNGVRQPLRSKRARRRQQQLANSKRVSAQHRRQDRATLAHKILQAGDKLVIEAADYRQWNRKAMRWGRTLGLTSPGFLHQALKQEALITGASFREIDPWTNASSQRCLCGARVKKSLSQRTHSCAECGLKADRDLLSAYLACLMGETGVASLDDLLPAAAKTLGAPPNLMGSGSRTGSSSGSPAAGGSRKASASDGRGSEAGRSGVSLRGVRAGSCAKDNSDPVSRRSHSRRASRMSGEASAAQKASADKDTLHKSPPAGSDKATGIKV